MVSKSPFLLSLLLLLPLLTFTQEAVDQSEYFGVRMGQGPFCDSDCLPNGQWKLRRDWVEGVLWTGGYDDAFIWAVDGDFSYWDLRCGQRVNDMIFGNRAPNTFVLQQCLPPIIYLMEYVIDYDHDGGLFTETLIVRQAYSPTQEAWDEFVQLVGERISPNFIDQELYTYPWTLFRVIPSMEGASVTDDYEGRVYAQKTYVANYERNFCSFTTSNLPIKMTEYCDYDNDLSSDREEFVSYLFCEYFFDSVVSTRFNIACGSTDDNDVCGRMYVGEDDEQDIFAREVGEGGFGWGQGTLPRESREEIFEKLGKWEDREVELKEELAEKKVQYEAGRGRPRRAPLVEAMETVRKGAKVKAVRMGYEARRDMLMARRGEEKREGGQRRDQYNYAEQPIESDWSEDAEPWGPFYYVPYTSSIVAPYCGYLQE